MTGTFLTFKEFNDEELAKEIAAQLQAAGIECVIKDSKYIFDVSFAHNTINPSVSLLLRPDDFTMARQVLNNFYKDLVLNVDKDYYLFDFTDTELVDIIMKPDEWGEFDYQLAQHILAQRGTTLLPEAMETINQTRIAKLAKPDKAGRNLIVWGYYSAFFGGLFGIVFGYNLAYSRKTMPNGQRLFSYGKKERKHGERIVLIGAGSVIFWTVLVLVVSLVYNNNVFHFNVHL